MTWHPMTQTQLETLVGQLASALLVNEDPELVRRAFEKALRSWPALVLITERAGIKLEALRGQPLALEEYCRRCGLRSKQGLSSTCYSNVVPPHDHDWVAAEGEASG